ncbi:MAG: hypothetical protein ABF575_09845 [Liquorilactobacillus hordei]|uniref:hypothetical protein n=1 Tax=Liquorilactobacillus hordei TaxID=468911 RepID=UPI0039E75167
MNVFYQFLRKKWLLFLFLFFIIIRIIIALRIPLFAQGNASTDDYLYIVYAKSLLAGHWLGSFNSLTLVKSISFSLFLVINYVLGIPYRFALILYYLFSVTILSYSIYKVTQKKVLSYILFIFLLYSPIMLHQENVQKIYRGGVLISSTILVIGAFIGLYASIRERKIKIIFWSILSSISLPFFYYLKEDSIWLMPFVVILSISSIITVIISKSQNFKDLSLHLLLIALPIFSLTMVTLFYKNMNYKYYDEYTITDRSGTYYKDFLHDLLVIQEGEKYQSNIWISKSAVEKAEKYSPTLRNFSDQLNNSFTNSSTGQNIEYPGDIIFWEFRDTFSTLYLHKNGIYANNFYKKVHNELLHAFNTGKLRKSNRFYLSQVSQGLRFSDILWFKNHTGNYFNTMISYKYNKLSVNEATGSFNQLLNMSELTHSPIIWPGTINTFFSKKSAIFVSFIQTHITKFYQSISKIVFIIGSIGILLLLLQILLQLLNKNYHLLPLLIVIFSMLLSAFALFIGVEWFSRFLSIKKFYDYISCAIPIMQTLEIIGCFFTFTFIINFFPRKKIKDLE